MFIIFLLSLVFFVIVFLYHLIRSLLIKFGSEYSEINITIVLMNKKKFYIPFLITAFIIYFLFSFIPYGQNLINQQNIIKHEFNINVYKSNRNKLIEKSSVLNKKEIKEYNNKIEIEELEINKFKSFIKMNELNKFNF